METTTNREAKMTNFARQIQSTASRMADSEGSRWHRELVPAASEIKRGSFYPGGPICLAAYNADGKYLGSVREADADRMARHPNSRRAA